MLEPLVDPGLVEAIAHFVDQYGSGLHVAAPALVTRFDASRQVVDVAPLMMHEYPDESGDRVIKALATMTAVPVAFGAVEHPLVPGDVVWVVHTTRAISAWLRASGPNVPVDPQVSRHHHLSDAFAIPYARRFVDAPSDFTSEATVVRAKGTSNEVRIGSPSASADANRVVIQSALVTFGQALNSAIQTLTASANPLAPAALLALQTLATALGIDPVTGDGWSAGSAQTKAG